MGYCGRCGSELKEGAEACPACGTVLGKEGLNKRRMKGYGKKVSIKFEKEDIQENKAVAVLAYLGILAAVPLFLAKDSKFARFHAGQGLAVLAASVGYNIMAGIIGNILTMFSWRFYYLIGPMRMAGAVFLVLSAMGIANAVNGEARELPIIGKWKLLK